MNPTLDPGVIAAALEADEAAARSEWLADFRSDLESYIARESLEAVTVVGRSELPPVPSVRYVGWRDAAGGGGQDEDALGLAYPEMRAGRLRPLSIGDGAAPGPRRGAPICPTRIGTLASRSASSGKMSR